MDKKDMIALFDKIKFHNNIRTKLYISCINYCPIQQRYIDIDKIIYEILFYKEHCSFDELCLSDTSGNLSFEHFVDIIQKCECNNIPLSLLSLHLHVNNDNIKNIKNILYYCFFKKINKFDVSMLETGGCTMAEQVNANLSYDLFYEILEEYEKEV
jgi:hypothetical protein